MNLESFKANRWLHHGLIVTGIGLFTILISIYNIYKYEAVYPELAISEADRVLDAINEKASPEKNAEKNVSTEAKEEAESHKDRFYRLHSMYNTYIYVGIAICGLGSLLLLVAFRFKGSFNVDDLDDDVDSVNEDK